MKKIFILTLILFTVLNCKKEDNNSENKGITIKGQIPLMQKSTKSEKSLLDAKRVLVFSKFFGATNYKIYDIINGSFSVEGQKGTGVALIFLDENNKYIGHLSTQNLNLLPLTNLINGDTTTIDLQTLSLEDNKIIPSHDPLGKEIQITQREINCLKAIDSYYKAIAENIDTDKDGIIDILSDKQIVVYTWIFLYGGKFGKNNIDPIVNDTSKFYTCYKMQIEGGINLSNENLLLYGPLENPYNDIKFDWLMTNPGGNRSFMVTFLRETQAPPAAPWGSIFLPFAEGTYKLTINNSSTHYFRYSNIDMTINLVLPIPVLITNSENKLTSIKFSYKLPDGSIINNPENIIADLMVQFFDSNMNQFFKESDNIRLTNNTGFNEINFSSPLDITNLQKLYVCYNDILGNQYFVVWD